MALELSIYKGSQGRYTRSITAVGFMLVAAALSYYMYTLLLKYVPTGRNVSMAVANADESWLVARAWPNEASPKYPGGTPVTQALRDEMGKAGTQRWTFAKAHPVPLALYIQLCVPVVLFLGGAAGAFWVVNYPHFADFLIATEGEMKKVAWSTKEELIGSTVVVLVTVFALAAVIFVADTAWIAMCRFVGAYGK